MNKVLIYELITTNKIVNMVNALPDDIRKDIIERSAAIRALDADPSKYVPN